MYSKNRSRLAAVLTTTVVTALVAAAPTTATADDRPTSSEGDRASRVLEEAQALFDEGSDPVPGRDATMVLRDLALAQHALTGTQQRQAGQVLARPTDPGDGAGYQTEAVEISCDSVCVHWVESTSDSVDTSDTNGNGRPDYVDSVIATMENVHDTYVGAGYRAPKADGTRGGNAKPDVYLADIGDEELYGYCASDDPTVPANGPYDAYAYCVLDNDFSPAQFPTKTPLENMQVTAAHEYFHAVQFGYDLAEDRWFMEATATWIEDEMYDGVDDSLNYLSTGPLARPWTSLDTFAGGTGFHYGTWIFFRFLSERFPAEVGGLPSLVRDMWDRADGASGALDQYSLQAVATVLKERGTTLPAMFAAFADGNRRPGATYSEGAEHGYLAAPDGKFVVKDGWATTKLDHMSSASTWVTPRKGFAKLKLIVDLAPKATGSAAVVTATDKVGAVTTKKIVLDRKGNGALTVPFSPKRVQRVDVTLVNASTRLSCWKGTVYSCQGIPVHDDLLGKLRGVLIR